MKKHLLFILLSIYSINSAAQSPIKGTVIDKDTQTPIPDVIVQYGASSREYVYTDAKGSFSLPVTGEEAIHFQCFGYKARTILKASLEQNPVVVMELNPVSLNPVIISPGDADMLLEEVMINTKKKLLTDASISYLLHFLQTKSTDTLQNEIYLKYATTLSEKDLKKELKKERVPYVFNIMDIKRVQRSVTPTSELYGAEYHASHLFTFGKSINNETTRAYSSDSSYIILQIEPLEGKDGWARGEVIINKEDMTIASMEIESVDSLLEIRPYKPYMGKKVKTLRKNGRFQFVKAADKYFMKECYTYYKFRAIDEFGHEEEITYYCDVDCRGLVDKKKYRNRRLSGYIQELFYFPDSTDREFWLDLYADDMNYLQYEFKGIAPNASNNWFWKSLLGAGGAFGIFLLINQL
ncbi:hypothetical protein GGR21_003918 [Dysgonomonas hofstadii]|uniref:CarboxypepD_reg-like domain-containing protein n=1 Tax=Dysgonomonas hofstadii TaxID=637886 RepID=A0A840D017_9BACT|nr:carboxypeptidase-like regulatory domain-containing protein [Dysgonomonas hofstadii]MBB4037992.1 hypothetical protein [Dysgonomonas hofstadii]